jgi:membrane protease YdiL (CAAX protease family)
VTDLKEALLCNSISPISMQIVFPYIAVALTALITVFHHSGLKRRFGDAKGMWLYFVLFFLSLVAVPTLIIVVVEPNPMQVLSDLGADPGNYKVGVLLILLAFPITVLVGHLAANTAEMNEWYPFSKEVCARDGAFAAYELGYILLYYSAWEFLYRGVLFFPLLNGFGFLPAMAITTALSTLHHMGHPKPEIVGAVVAGVLFCFVALLTRSIIYPIAIHAMVGVSVDTFIYQRNYRGSSGR